jgi:hypothetical protein
MYPNFREKEKEKGTQLFVANVQVEVFADTRPSIDVFVLPPTIHVLLEATRNHEQIVT